MRPLPLTPRTIKAVQCQFKAQGYRSFANYVGTVADHHREEYPCSDELDRARRQSLASTQRGIGPPRQCCEIPIHDVFLMGKQTSPIASCGPICHVEWAIINAFHLTRGTESACALASSVVINETTKRYEWALPVSKTDPQACGCSASVTRLDLVRTVP